MKLAYFLAAAFVAVIFLGNFVFLFGSVNFHSSEFQKLGINETPAMNAVAFVNGKAGLSSDFNQRESSHLEDVKGVFTGIKLFYYAVVIGIGAVVMYLLRARKLKQLIPSSLIISGVLSLLLLLMVFLFSLNFAGFFSVIHKPFFSSGTWLFPADSLLIQSFPQQFFQDFTTNLLYLILVNSAMFLAIGLFIRKKFKHKKQI